MIPVPSGTSKGSQAVTAKAVDIQMFWYFIWKTSIFWKLHFSG